MSRIPITRVLCLIWGVLLFFPSTSLAQRTFGVSWEIPSERQEAVDQLNYFERLHVSYLEIDEIVSDELWNEIQQRNFKIYVRVPVAYPVVETFLSPDSSLVETYHNYLTTYAGREIEAIGAFAYGQTQDSQFSSVIKPYIDQIHDALPDPMYYKEWSLEPRPIDSLFDFRISRVNVTNGFESSAQNSLNNYAAYHYNPSSNLKYNVAPLKWFMEQTSVNTDAILFFDSTWLLNFLDRHHNREQIFIEHATYKDAVLPLPDEELPAGNDHSIIVVLLVFLWGTVALNYSFNPMYRRSLFRYFLSHQFFIDDVMQRHIRSLSSSIIVLIQHSILGGIVLYTMAGTFLSATGIEVFYYYFPALDVFGLTYFSFFLLGMIFTLVFELISVTWLFIANRKVQYLSQVSILFAWPFHVNLVIATVIVTLLMANTYIHLQVVAFILFFAVLLGNFPLTAFNTGQNIKKHKWAYAVGTLGLYGVLVAVGFLAIVTNDFILDVLDLATSIS